ncbi:MAG TPA: NADH-quinone oxidoreductase subunit H [Planctomycetota bacterium]|nr:NADH-quinone oxidoreductase subunit H [Planctomycetota bacterium]
MDSALHIVIHFVLVLLLSPLLPGIINRTKAAFAGRTGPPLFQLYYDLLKLFQKGMVFSRTTTWVFRAGPVIGLMTTLVAAMLVPLGHHPAPVAFAGDMILLTYLLALGRFFTATAALDTGSPFEGMGAAREVTFSCLSEPALFFGLIVLAKLSGSSSLSGMLSGSILADWGSAAGPIMLVAASWFIILLVENCRIPFDDPNTHLELTMIHEVMVLDHSGPALGMILYGAAVKLFVTGALVVGVAYPLKTGNTWLDWGLFLAMMAFLAILIGVVESTMARLRLVSIPKLMVSACLLSAFGVVFLIKVK